MKRNTAMLVSLLTLVACSALGMECENQKAEYARLNRLLVIKNHSDARAYPSIERDATNELHKYIEAQILDQLRKDEFPQPTNIIARIRCIQSDIVEYSKLEGVTNTPLVIVLSSNRPSVAVAFDLYRGGAGSPSMRPYLEVFSKTGKNWIDCGEVGAELTGFTFNVSSIAAPRIGQDWFLIWGNGIGSNGHPPLRVVVVAYDGTSLREIWSSPDRVGVWVSKVADNYVILEGEMANAQGRAEDFMERYDVVPTGLKFAGKTILKTY